MDPVRPNGVDRLQSGSFMRTTKLTKKQREEKIDELLLLHEALPEWTVEEIVRSAIRDDVIPLRLEPPRFEDFGYSEEEYHSDRRKRRDLNQNLARLPWKCAIGLALIGGLGSFLIASLRPSFVPMGLVGLVVGAILGLLYKTLRSRRAALKEYELLGSFERELFAYVYWSKRRAAEFWKSLSGVAFERELARVFRLAGYEASLTSASRDEGIDIILKREGTTGIVQCKAHRGPVGPNVVRELLGSAVHFNADFAMLASTSGFTPASVEFAAQKSIILLEVPDIIRMQESGPSNSFAHQHLIIDDKHASAGNRVLHFPTHLAFGEIYTRESQTGDGELILLAAAQGRVKLPKDCRLHLRVENPEEIELSPDLSPLNRLQRDDIKELDLFSLLLEDHLLECVARLDGLEWLRLRGMSLTDQAFEYLGQLTNLRTLIIGFGQFSGVGISHLRPLINLEELHLDGIIDFTNEGLGSVSKLDSLRKLSLQMTDVTSQGLARLARLPKLERLSIGPFVEVDEEMIHELKRFRALTILEFLDPEPGTLAALQSALPNCQVIADPRT